MRLTDGGKGDQRSTAVQREPALRSPKRSYRREAIRFDLTVQYFLIDHIILRYLLAMIAMVTPKLIAISGRAT
jgi:hypothetical protein